MAYEMVMPYHLHMPSYFLETFTEYPNGDLSDLTAEADNDFTDIIDKLTVYPVLKFRLCGKIF